MDLPVRVWQWEDPRALGGANSCSNRNYQCGLSETVIVSRKQRPPWILRRPKASQGRRKGLARRLPYYLVCALFVVGCSAGTHSTPTSPPSRGVLDSGYGTMSTLRPLGPGVSLALVGQDVANPTDQPIELLDASVRGPGIGPVLNIESVEVAPAYWGRRAVASGIYGTYPPVLRVAGVCHVQELHDVRGFRIAPGASFRLLVLVQTTGIGSFRARGITLTYRYLDSELEQVVRHGYAGQVVASSDPPSDRRAARGCQRYANYLPTGETGPSRQPGRVRFTARFG
jgi:hypothetical protein